MTEQRLAEQTLIEQKDTDQRESRIQRLKRRGVLAAAWAAVMSIVAKRTEQPVQAITGGSQGTALLCGTTNTETAFSEMKWAGSPASTVMLLGNDTPDDPVGTGYSAAIGGWAGGTGGTFAGVRNGVYGFTSATSGNGVVGICTVGNGSSGVYGSNGAVGGAGVTGFGGNSYGVVGLSYLGVGVRGEIPANATANATAIYGLNYSSYAGPSPGAGGFAVYGLSANGHGLVGATAASGAAAVVGATNGVAGAYAATFYGPVVVSGALTVVGGPKSAAVPHPDGSHRLLYCVESPESWFEDFGEGHLECGTAEVMFDPDFAAVANLDEYHVFLTEYEDHHALYVTKRTANGFSVQAKGDASTGAFSWRVVAKRKDIAGERLAKILLPSAPDCPVPTPAPSPAPGPMDRP